MNAKKILYVFTHGPYSNSHGQEALDAVFIGAAFEQIVSVLFLHDGIFQLKKNQQVGDGGLKAYTKAFRALEDFGIENCYVHDLGLLARGLDLDELEPVVLPLNSIAIKSLISAQDRVFTF